MEHLRASVCLLALALLASCSDRAIAQEEPAQVTVVNLTDITIEVMVNNGAPKSIEAAFLGDVQNEEISFPSGQIDSASDPEPGAFGRDTNEVVVTGAGATHIFSLSLPSSGSYPLNRGFTLLITENVAVMMNDLGSVVAQATIASAG